MAESDDAPESWTRDQWMDLFRKVVGHTIRPGENLEDVVVGGWILGERRANLLGRAMAPGEDVPHALSVFCWWPLKPALRDDSRRFLYSARQNIFEGASISGRWADDVRDIIPDEILTLQTHELFAILRDRPVWEFVRERSRA